MFDDNRSLRPLLRLAVATALLGLAGAALAALAPDPVGGARSLASVQRLADTAGADAVVVRVAGLLAWLVWGWGSLGVALTAAGQLPGAAGALARGLLRLAVPAAARRATALALGIGLNGTVLAGPALAAPVPSAGPAVATAAAPATGAPDWPGTPPGTPPGPPPGAAAPPTVPDRPAAPAGTHLVVRGDCLWRIARSALPATGTGSAEARVADAVQAWWRTNAAVIGPDPDLLRPGQVLHAPDAAARGGDR